VAEVDDLGLRLLVVVFFNTSAGVQSLALVLGVKELNAPTGLASATCRPCTRSPLNGSLFVPDRVTARIQRKGKIQQMNAIFVHTACASDDTSFTI